MDYHQAVDADRLSAYGAAASAGISVFAGAVSIAAWRAAKRSAAAAERSADADEQTGIVEAIRLHGDLKPRWDVRIDPPVIPQSGFYRLRILATLSNPQELTAPCELNMAAECTIGDEAYSITRTWEDAIPLFNQEEGYRYKWTDRRYTTDIDPIRTRPRRKRRKSGITIYAMEGPCESNQIVRIGETATFEIPILPSSHMTASKILPTKFLVRLRLHLPPLDAWETLHSFEFFRN